MDLQGDQDRYRLSLPPGVRVRREPDVLSLGGVRAGLTLEGPMLGLSPLIEGLEAGERQAKLMSRVSDPATMPFAFYLIAQLDGQGLLCRSAYAGETVLATLAPIGGQPVRPQAPAEAGLRYRMSRFAYARREGEDMVLETPRSAARLLPRHSAAWSAIQRLARPATVAQIAADCDLEHSEACDLMGLLIGGGFVEPADVIESEALRQWEFHDLLFHSRSRLGGHDQPYGGAYLFDDIAPLPALKPAGEEPLIALAQALPDDGSHADLAALMRARRSRRVHGPKAVGLDRLGAFLHRGARHLQTLETEHGELAARPYPAGGALHELELYLAVDRCDGLEAGLYHYRPGDHALERMADDAAATNGLLEQASMTLSGAGRPQVLIVIAARFQRLQWKYRSVTYALALKHVGVVFQTFYLLATDMGLAACAMGGGDSALFARASGLDPLIESSVGEFALGSLGGEGDEP